MPVATEIAVTATSYKWNSDLLRKSFTGLTAEEWLGHPNDCSNHMLWEVGHVIWARASVVRVLGAPWTAPWLPLFARGVKLADSAAYPTAGEMEAAFHEIDANLKAALEGASSEELRAPAPEKIPSFDGTLAGTIAFMSWHETYHVGQAAYLRRWLGHQGLLG